MRSIAETEVFTKRALQLLEGARIIVDRLPTRDHHGGLLRCHEVARVVGSCLELEVIDGRYEYGHEHSWCIVHHQPGDPTRWSILDPYTIGRIPPVQLVAVLHTMPNRYFPEARRTDIRDDVVQRLIKWVRSADE